MYNLLSSHHFIARWLDMRTFEFVCHTSCSRASVDALLDMSAWDESDDFQVESLQIPWCSNPVAVLEQPWHVVRTAHCPSGGLATSG